MRYSFIHIIGAFLLPHAAQAQNSTTNSTSGVGLLSSGNVNLGDWQGAYEKAKALVGNLTNAEKISIITGQDVSSFSALASKDSTQGPQGYDYVTGWSESSALIMTWDKTLIWNQFKADASEFYWKGFQVANAPTTGPLGRTPWGGRIVEGLSQDSYLNGIAFGIGAKAFTETGVISGGKHFLLYEQETNRQSGRGGPGGGSTNTSSVAPYSSDADDKTLHETYLWAWYDGVKNGMGAVMCAMNKVNSSASCESESLLQYYLKTEIGFPGYVNADVSGQSTALGSANGGLDIGSSSYWSNATLGAALANGSFTQARLDDMAIRDVIGYFYVGLDNGTHPDLVSSSAHVDVRGNHSAIVRQNGAASIALLKNTNGALPLKKPLSMALFGASAGPDLAGPNYEFSVGGTPSTYTGHLAGGAGSGQTSFPYLITPYQALNYRASQDGTMIRHIMNDTWTDTISSGIGGGGGGGFGGNSTGNGTGPGMGGGGGGGGVGLAGLSGGTSLTQTFTGYATNAEVCLVFLNAFSGEGADRTELRNDVGDTMVTTVASTCNNTVVVVNTVGARILDTWIENENVTAVLYSGLLGQESGNAIVDVLYGVVNPSARLPHTIAKTEDDYNVAICTTAICEFTEGNHIDYKYFDAYNVTPRYEFGYGLSYTTFSYSNLSLNIVDPNALGTTYPKGPLSVGGKTDLWDEVVTLSVTIANTGFVDGNEVAQLYVQFPDAAGEPVRQLRGFERTLVATGASETVVFSLRRRDLSIWDTVAQEWAIVDGNYVFSVGASSRDLRVEKTLTV